MKNALLFALFLGCLSCRKTSTSSGVLQIPYFNCSNSTNEINTSKNLIKGTWHWSSETVLRRGQPKSEVITPSTECYSKDMVITDNSISFYKNEKIISTSIYDIDLERKLSLYEQDTTPMLLFRYKDTQNYENGVYFKLCTDSLFLDWSIRSDIKGREIWYKK